MTNKEKKQLSDLIKESSDPKLLRSLINKLTKAPNILLKKYMQHINFIEGMTYLGEVRIYSSNVNFTDNENEVLKLIESEL